MVMWRWLALIVRAGSFYKIIRKKFLSVYQSWCMSYDTSSSLSLPLKIKIEHKDGFTGHEINFFF